MKSGWRLAWLCLAGAALFAAFLTADTSPVRAQETNQEAAQEQDIRFDNGYCLGCHDGETAGISLSNIELPSGEILDINVHRDTYENSVHGQLNMSCVLCHTDISEFPHDPIEAEGLRDFAVANYTYGKERDDVGPDFPADRIPPFNGQLGLEYYFSESWRFEPYLLFAGRQDRLSPRDAGDPRINPLGTPAWGSLNLLLDWQATPMLQLGLRLENLTGRDYREHASGIDAPGRNAGLWVNLQF